MLFGFYLFMINKYHFRFVYFDRFISFRCIHIYVYIYIRIYIHIYKYVYMYINFSKFFLMLFFLVMCTTSLLLFYVHCMYVCIDIYCIWLSS